MNDALNRVQDALQRLEDLILYDADEKGLVTDLELVVRDLTEVRDELERQL